MLHLHFSNRFERLRDGLLKELGTARTDAFSADQVIVPNTAVRRALTLAAADRFGIAANLGFGYLAQWLWQQIARVVPGVAEDSPFAASTLTWQVFEAFRDPSFVTPHPRLHRWLQEADEVMQLELARSVAALLEQTLTYRPDWLDAWMAQRSALPPTASATQQADELWQAALWRRIDARITRAVRDPAGRFMDELARLTPAQALTLGLPACAHVFALPAIAPLHLSLLRSLGRVCELHLHVLNPCQEFWFDLVDGRRLSWLEARGRAQGLEIGHPLLTAWGQQTQSHIGLLVEHFGEELTDDSAFEAPGGNSLLAQLQTSLLELSPLAPGSLVLAPDDRSLEVRVCHGMTRELEVLHDHLLGVFAGDIPALHDLHPSEVLVVTPDIDLAAPLIEAVFATAPAARRIGVNITGRAASRVNAPARALLAVLSLAGSRLLASELFDLLQQDLVRRRFSIDEAGLQQIHRWILASGYRWGLDAAHRIDLALPGTMQHTLTDGLDRLLLGYALPDPLAEPFDGRLPACAIEGSDTLTLGAFWAFTDAVKALHQHSGAPRPPADWIHLLRSTLDTFIDAQGDELDDLRELKVAISDLADSMSRGGLSEPVGLPVIRAALASRLDDSAQGAVPGGGVTFASMSTLRGLPYRLICAIGLNDGSFPGAHRPAEFDLLALQPRPGDRQRRIDDRNLFLDLVLSARDALYLSYSGRSIRDNSMMPPSVLVDELLDTLGRATVLIAPEDRHSAPSDDRPMAVRVRARLVVEHSLQAFSPEAFNPDGDLRLRSFRTELAQALAKRFAITALAPPSSVGGPIDDPIDAPVYTTSGDVDTDSTDSDETFAASSLALPFFSRPLPAPDARWQEVPLDWLLQFFANPCRFLLGRRLGIELPRTPDELIDEEPFVLGTPARRSLAARLLPRMMEAESSIDLRALARAGTDLPSGTWADAPLSAEIESLQAFADRVRALSPGAQCAPLAVDASVDLDGTRWRITGAVPMASASGTLAWRHAPLRATDRLHTWITLLALGASSPQAPRDARFVAQDSTLRLRLPTDPSLPLRSLVDLYRRGLSEPLHFFPGAAWAYVAKNGSLKAARDVWRPQRAAYAESDDPAYQLALRGTADPLDASFEDLAQRVFMPLKEHLHEQP